MIHCLCNQAEMYCINTTVYFSQSYLFILILVIIFSFWVNLKASNLSPSLESNFLILWENLCVSEMFHHSVRYPMLLYWYFVFKQSPDGDIIDCVHMSHQPAFDHPFLKDHKIQVHNLHLCISMFKKKKNFCKLLPICLVFLVYQMRPSYHPEGLFDENKVAANPIERSSPVKQLWHQNGKCPEGTIPVRRTKEDDILRASSIKRYGRKKRRTAPQPRSADPDLINQSGHQVIKVVTFFFFLK